MHRFKTGRFKTILFFSSKDKRYKEFLDTCGYCLRTHNGWDIPHCWGLSQTHEEHSNNLLFLEELEQAPRL